MGLAFHQLYYHFAWATSGRRALIDRTWRPQLLEILHDEVQKRGGAPLRHNAMPDHAHLLVRLPPTATVSTFIGEVKGATAYRVNHDVAPRSKLHWQEGHGVMTLRRDEVEKVPKYIDHQEEHHGKGRLSVLLETTEGDDDDSPEGVEKSP